MCEWTDVDQKQFQWPEQTFAESEVVVNHRASAAAQLCSGTAA